MKKVLFAILAMAFMACSGDLEKSKNPLMTDEEWTNYDGDSTKGFGVSLADDNGTLEMAKTGFAGKSKLMNQSFDSSNPSPSYRAQAAYWPAINRNDVYGLIESFTNYTHYDARTGVTLPVVYNSVPVGVPESICIVQNGQFRCDLTATVSTNTAYPLPMTSHCAFGGINDATSYYPMEMFSAPHDIVILYRNNNGPIFPQNHFVTSGAYATNCNKYFYRVTVNVQGYPGDPITAATDTRHFSTSSWDRVQNDFPMYTSTVSNSTNDGRLIQFYVTSNTPVLFKPEYRTANILWTYRIGAATLQSVDRWAATTPTVGAWVNVPACTGTSFVEAFDLDSATGVTNVDEGYLARFDHTVAGCVQPQANVPFSVEFQ